MHEPDQVVLLKMPPVLVHWLKVKTENTNKEATKFAPHDQLLQQLHLKLSIFIPFVLLLMHFKNYLEPVSVLCIEIYSKFR